MQEIPELTPEIKSFAKFILASKDDPAYDVLMAWFKTGAWYMDAMSMLVLTLPDDDPTLAEILGSIRTGTLYENEIVAKNILRFGMAVGESVDFIITNSKAESLLLHVRALVQNSTKQANHDAIPTTVFRVLSSTILKLTWFLIKREFRKVGSSFSARGSLSNRWKAALDDPLWWLILGATGALIFL